MTNLMSLAPMIAAGLLAGLAIGAFHFATLRWSAGRLVDRQGRGAVWLMGLVLLRFGLLAAVLMVVARQGAPALIASALGIWLARAAWIARVRRAEDSHR